MKTHIVIPIGIGAPGTPVQEYLEKSVNSVLSQTSKEFILTVAADANVPDRCKKFLEEKKIEVKWFEPFTYFRKGGIWKKIFDTWKDKDTKYLAFLHYDDLWDFDKLRIQVEKMESENLEASWSEAYIMDNSGIPISHDCSFHSLSKETVGSRSIAFAHSVIVSRDSMMNSGILDHESLWAANFEDVWAFYIHKIQNVSKAPGAKFYWRNHSLNISNTVNENAEFVKEQRYHTAYSLKETLADSDKISMYNLSEKIRLQYL
jgi:glycosyltransferase involved in cell wall biosynthesis